MTSKVGKRPLRSLSAHEKMEAIRRVHDGESKASVARDIGVPESTLRGWCKNEDKILYLSRQSTPDTDESDHLPSREKKQRYDSTEISSMQPFNLSVRGASKSPPPAVVIGGTAGVANSSDPVASIPVDSITLTADTTEVPLALNLTKQESPKLQLVNIPAITTPVSTSSTAAAAADKERERNRAELTRLSIELGLNRPEMFLPNSSNSNIAANLSDLSASLTANLGLVAQWNNALLQQVNNPKKRSSQLAGLDSVVMQQQSSLPPSQPQIQSQPIVSTTSPMCTNSSSITPHHYNNNNNTTKSSKSKKQHLDTHNVDDSVWYWLKTQQAMLGLVQNSTTQNLPQNVVDPTNSSWFWKWYKQLAYGQMQQSSTGQQISQQLHQQHQLQQHQQQLPQTPEKPILYQQLTKDINSENQETPKSTKQPLPVSQSTKVRAVLDNLLLNNNNNEDGPIIENGKRDSAEGTKTAEETSMTPASTAEALCHGEMFLRWLERCGDPSVTAVQILQLRYLLNNIKTGADRKNGVPSEHKNKIRSRK